MLSIFGVASTGVNFYRSSLDAIAHNVANLNTVRARDELALRVIIDARQQFVALDEHAR